MALMSLGPVVFDLVTNLDTLKMDTEAVFARHDVVGAAPILEAMGDGETRRTLIGTVHPAHTGTNGGLAALEAAKAAQMPLPLMRGDYTPLGYFVIEELSRDEKFLTSDGLGLEIEFSVTLQRVADISALNPAAIIRLFASAIR